MSTVEKSYNKLINNKLDPILIIEDDEIENQILKEYLEKSGYQVLTSFDSATALNIIRSKPLSLIISDQNLPGKSGIEILEEAKKISSDTTTVLLTGEQNPQLAIDAINRCNVTHLLHKPYDPEHLQLIVQKSVERYLLIKENQKLHQELLKQHASLSQTHHALKQDIQLGEKIYEQMLLGTPPDHVPGLLIHSISLPCKDVDGDFYDFFQPSDSTLDVVIGDVMGKGIPAALVATALKAQLMRFAQPTERKQTYTMRMWTEGMYAPHEIIERVHEELVHRLIKLEYFASLFYGRFDLRKRRFSYVDCGSTKPIHISNGAIHHLKGDAAAIGMFEEIGYDTIKIDYKPEDLFLFYSDGITEAKSPSGEMFGIERLEKIVLENQELKPFELITVIRDAIMFFTQATELQDDLTMVAIKATDELIPEVVRPVSAKFESHLSQLEAVRDFTYRICQNAPGNSDRLAQQMQLAINEIFCNIVDHGLENDAHGHIVIQAELGPDGITFDIADQAPSYNPELINEPSLAGDRDNGFGWYLLKKIADQISYTHKKQPDGWNHLTVYKTYEQREYPMEISHELKDDVLIIKPEFDTLDAKEVPVFKETITDIIDNKNPTGCLNVILDMHQLDFVDSSGLGSFLSLMRNLRDSGGQLKLANMKKPVFTIFELVSMTKAFEIYDSTEDAMKSFANQG